jgi:hypothetical protein
MLEFVIDNIFVIFGGRVFQQTDGIPMGTNYAPLLADLFRYSNRLDTWVSEETWKEASPIL